MGMFDQLVPFSDHFKDGEFFTIVDAKVGNEMTTEYGEGTPVLLKIRTKEDGEKWFSLFGQALVNQIGRMEPGELRGGVEVAIVRKANKANTYEYKVLATRQQIEDDDIPF